MSYTGIATLQVWVDDKPEPNLRLRVTAIDKRRAHKRVLNRAVRSIEARTPRATSYEVTITHMEDVT